MRRRHALAHDRRDAAMILVDLDGDGACGVGDAVYQTGFYGWASDIAIDLGAQDWGDPDEGRPVTEASLARCALLR